MTPGEELLGMLQCVVSGHPPPTIHWTGAQGQIIRNSHNTSVVIDFTNGVLRSTLKLEDISSQDLGNYSCQAENKMGKVGLFFY